MEEGRRKKGEEEEGEGEEGEEGGGDEDEEERGSLRLCSAVGNRVSRHAL